MDIHARLNDELANLACAAIENYAEDSWSFDFGGKAGLNVQCPWRIVNKNGIAISGKDHGQKFGLSEPVNVSQVAASLLFRKPSKDGSDYATNRGRCHLLHKQLRATQVFNDSSGFEGWNIGTKSGINMFGMGGGDIAVSESRHPEP